LPLGSKEPIMMAHGFYIETMHNLVRNAPSAAKRRTVKVGPRSIAVKWLEVTDAGRRRWPRLPR
jgi:hypothetical protein